jgi:serine protease AprX
MRQGPNGMRSDVRSSALWGAGNRKGELRSSALWGKSGKRVASLLLVATAFALPLAASAGRSDNRGKATYVSPGLLTKAHDSPATKIRIIVQSNEGMDKADKALKDALKTAGSQGSLKKQLRLIGAVSIEVPAATVDALAKIEGLTITPDAPVKVSGGAAGPTHSSTQLWPYESGAASLWYSASSAPTIAIVDSGVDTTRADFAGRTYPQVNLSSLSPNATGDDRGHGTFVAGIAAGDALGKTGAAPAAKILPIRVMDQNGVAMTSDVIRACQWIFENKGSYNIRVANLSLHSAMPSRFINDPLDKAVEKLWFSGVVVVVAAGNYGTAGQPSGVRYAPGNDPFVITVGAADLGGTVKANDDSAAPWSAYGYTYDGFAKPDLGAPGRFMIGPVPTAATLTSERADRVVSPGYMQLSGTSFAAPVVAGAAASMLALHPSWTPDQVKGAIMLTAKPVPEAVPLSLGVGELNAGKAAQKVSNPPNPNKALNQFLVSASDGAGKVFDAASWADYARTNASWADASWADASWADASWSTASWADASWAEASWADGAFTAASWADASWADASWADVSHEDAAEGDPSGPDNGYVLDPAAQADLASDPDLAVPAGALPPTVTSALP